MKFIYPAVIRKTETGAYRASFPDLEDCHAEGETIDEVLDNANAAAYDWITVELEDNDHLPPVTDIRDIELKDGEIARHISVTMRFMEGWEE